ncbi:hypothetical protein T01_53 [Trichinella spiralis]|uniref:Uncharacterized protein n=1 Tax=Trichinella spiralis TaxID=6334 RepID=A0A0V1BD41_TRISP|nr:hypothetical protein T01_53 [Trichinella spiralis]
MDNRFCLANLSYSSNWSIVEHRPVNGVSASNNNNQCVVVVVVICHLNRQKVIVISTIKIICAQCACEMIFKVKIFNPRIRRPGSTPPYQTELHVTLNVQSNLVT